MLIATQRQQPKLTIINRKASYLYGNNLISLEFPQNKHNKAQQTIICIIRVF